MKKFAKRAIERLTGVQLMRSLPRGTNFFHDLRTRLPGLEVRTIFDVGSGLGRSATYCLEEFPAAEIWCFEPAPETCRRLQAAFGKKVRAFDLAFGARDGPGYLIAGGASDRAVLHIGPSGPSQQAVSIMTLADFCRSHSIDRIDYLKVDTEGGELDVLGGGEAMLKSQAIASLVVEAGMNGENELPVPLADFQRFLEPLGYFLFGIYDQVEEWPTGRVNLRRVDAAFVSRQMVDAHRRAAAP